MEPTEAEQPTQPRLIVNFPDGCDTQSSLDDENCDPPEEHTVRLNVEVRHVNLVTVEAEGSECSLEAEQDERLFVKNEDEPAVIYDFRLNMKTARKVVLNQ